MQARIERDLEESRKLGTPGDAIFGMANEVARALQQVRTLLRQGVVVARDGTRVPLRADTLCLHGDRPDAAAFALGLRQALEAEGVTIRAAGTQR